MATGTQLCTDAAKTRHDIPAQYGTALVLSIRDRLDNLPPVVEGDACKPCIYKIPKQLQGMNDKSYTPKVVSLGPYTHGMKGLEFMENVKLRYLKTFQQQSGMSIKDLVMFISKHEKEARACYASAINFDNDKFVKIILVDAAFILVTLVKHHKKCLDFSEYEHGNCSFDGLRHDFGLLENQLPFFVLEKMFEKIKSSDDVPNSSVPDLAFEFFKVRMLNEEVNLPEVVSASESCGYSMLHFVDLLRLCHIPSSPVPRGSDKTDAIRKRSLTLTNLHEAGVKFEVSKSKQWVDIKFEGGVLEIPYMRINDNTETILRNIAAFEQCHLKEERYITDYIIAVAKLVNTSKDAEILAKKGIVLNDIGQSEHVANLFYKLDKDALYDAQIFYYARLFNDLDSHCQKRWYKWFALLKHEYLKSPWKIISLIAAVILLVLASIQTVFTILRFVKDSKS